MVPEDEAIRNIDNDPYRVPPIAKQRISKSKRFFRWKLVVAIFGIPILAVSVFVFGLRVLYTARESMGRTEMHRRIELLREKELPVDQESLQAKYINETSDRETEAWNEILSNLDSQEFKASYDGVPNFDPQIDDIQFNMEGDWQYENKAIAFTVRWKEMVKSVQRLASKEEVVGFSIRFKSLDTELKSVDQLRWLARMIHLDGLLSLRQGDSMRTRRDIECLFELSKIASRIPFSPAMLASVSFELQGFELIRNGLEWNQLAEQDLIALLPTISRGLSIGARWSDVMKAELGTAVPIFVKPNLGMKINTRVPSRGYDCIAYLNLMERALDLDTADFDNLLTGARKLESDLRKLHSGVLPAMDHILVGILAPAFEAYAEVFVELASTHRLAVIAIKTRLLKEQEGRFPNSLSELETIGDQWQPIGGKPFGYEVRGEHAVLWGFQLKEYSACPESPPSTIGETRMAKKNREWIWVMK